MQADAGDPPGVVVLPQERRNVAGVLEKFAVGDKPLPAGHGKSRGRVAACDFFNEIHGTGVPRSRARVVFSRSSSSGERQPAFHERVIVSWPACSEKKMPMPGGALTEGTW